MNSQSEFRAVASGFSRPPPPSEDVCVWSLLQSVGVGWVVSGCVGASEVAEAGSLLPSLELLCDVSPVTTSAGACSLSSCRREEQTVMKLHLKLHQTFTSNYLAAIWEKI